MACRYCFVTQNTDYIDIRTAMDAADFLAANAKDAIPSINFFGGEPLLMWDDIIVPLVNYARGKYGERFHFSITSNCTLMTEDKLAFMKGNGIGLLFSIDGDRETQDRNRPLKNGQSSFHVLKEKIPLVLRYYPNVMFRATTTQETARHLFHNILFAEHEGFRSFFTIPNCFESWDDMRMLRAEMRRYSDYYIESLRSGRMPIILPELEKRYAEIIRYNNASANGKMREHATCRSCGKCGLGAGHNAGINLNGDIVACQEFFSSNDRHFVIGNIYTGVDDEARQRLCDEFDGAQATGDRCGDCVLNRICDGGCVANNHMLYGDMHKNSPVMCEWSRILFEEAVYIMKTLGEEKNELFKERWEHAVR